MWALLPPGARILICRCVIPWAFDFSTTLRTAFMAVNGLPLFMSLSDTCPPDEMPIVSAPVMSVMWIIVLFADEYMLAIPAFCFVAAHLSLPWVLLLSSENQPLSARPRCFSLCSWARIACDRKS